MINWGILGTGNIAKTFAKAIKDTSVSSLLAVGSRSKESAELFSSKFSCIGYGSYQQLLDNKEINAIKDLAKKEKLNIITTEKDYYRLNKKQRKDIKILKVKLEIKKLDKFKKILFNINEKT